MGSCEICGKRYESLDKAIVEGVIINVCSGCSRFGKVITIKKPSIEPEKIIQRKYKNIEEDVVEDYNGIIKKARERKGLKQEELALSISEKESIIHKIETGSLKPSFTLAKKLEQFLGIKLIELQEEKKDVSLNLKDSRLTIGDLLRVKNRKV